jgi:hypothetical protein
VFPDQLEGDSVMVKGGRLPTGCSMAGLAVRAQLTLVRIIFAMTGRAASRRAGEELVFVAARANRLLVFTGQLEGAGIMIKRGRLPEGSIMARSAVRAQLASMGIILLMAGGAVRGGMLEIRRGMAALTFGLLVLTHQRKAGVLAVIKCRYLPILGGVAGSAVTAHHALVRIVFLMAGRAGGGCIL